MAVDVARRRSTEAPWWDDAPGRRLLALFLLTDAVFAVLSLAADLGLVEGRRLSLSTDRGFPETWGYVQLLWSGVALGVLLWRYREPVFVALGALVGYLLADDALRVHERAGEALVGPAGLRPMLGVEASDLGEVVVSAVAASVLLVLVVGTAWRASPWARRVAVGVVGCAAAMAVAGLGIDFVDAQGEWMEPLLSLLEDGGELVAGSVLAAFLLSRVVVGDGVPVRWRRT